MTYLQALYGSQYRDLRANGYDGTKARFNGNIFLTAFIVITLFMVLMILVLMFPSIDKGLTKLFHQAFGYSSGKTIGKLLAIPLMAVIYWVVINTVGNESNCQRLIEEFNQLPEKEQATAKKKLLVPFFVVLGLMLVMMFSSLF